MSTPPGKAAADDQKPAEVLPVFDPWWLDEDTWPLDVPHSVFLGRALQLLGSALVEGWDGREFAAQPAKPFPVPTITHGALTNRWTQAEASRAWQLVGAVDGAEGRPDLMAVFRQLVEFGVSRTTPHNVVRRGGIYSPSRSAPPPPTDPAELEQRAAVAAKEAAQVRALVDRARQIVQAQNSAYGGFAARAATLRRLVTQACVNGELSTGYRGTDGVIYVLGENLTDGSRWNVEPDYLGPRFTTCKVDRLNQTKPPAHASWKREFCWLYVERSSLAAYLARAERAATPRPSGKQAAIRELRSLCETHARGQGALPVGAVWREDAQERFEIGPTAAKAAWGIVAAQYPALSSMIGKPKRRRDA